MQRVLAARCPPRPRRLLVHALAPSVANSQMFNQFFLQHAEPQAGYRSIVEAEAECCEKRRECVVYGEVSKADSQWGRQARAKLQQREQNEEKGENEWSESGEGEAIGTCPSPRLCCG